MSTRNDYCCVPQCTSWAKKNQNLSFFTFPRENKRKVYLRTMLNSELMDRRKAWIIKLKIVKPVTKYMKVCSLHFTDGDYFPKAENTNKRKLLKRAAVPSQKLPHTLSVSTFESTSKPSSERYQERKPQLKYKEYTCYSTKRSEQELLATEALIQLAGGPTTHASDLD